MKDTELVQLLRELADYLVIPDIEHGTIPARRSYLAFHARQAADEVEGREVPMLELVVKPCGDCWLQIKAPSGRQAAINLGQQGSFNDQAFIGSVILEVAELTHAAQPEPHPIRLCSTSLHQKPCPTPPPTATTK